MIGTFEDPWVGMARDEAREWWRDHPGASFDEFDEWVFKRYEPFVLLGSGHQPGRRLTTKLREILDQVHEGLAEAVDMEKSRQRAPRVVA